MGNEKDTLMEQIRAQRFLPITEGTYSLYTQFGHIIDAHNPDELSFLRFHEGEYFFRIGDFESALNHLTRALSAPKQTAFKYLDALSYNIIGLIYSLLDLQHISLSYLLQFRSMCDELHLVRESAICYANLGLIYGELEAYDVALPHLDTALSYALCCEDSNYNLRLICQAYRGIFCCKKGDIDSALEIYHTTVALTEEDSPTFYEAAIFNFYIRIAEILHDDAMLHEYLDKMLTPPEHSSTFLEVSEFYFDICSYFLERRMQPECKAILDYIQSFDDTFLTSCLAYKHNLCRATYARLFASPEEYLDACDAIFSLDTRYIEEQNHAKLYSLEYIEHLNQTKSDSEMYLAKSRIDQMTGLLNKYTIQFLVTEDLSKADRKHHSAMILLDLDHFKQINDTLGHLVGDSFIQQTASVIQNFFKDGALCGRVGGDEFLVYISNVADPSLLILQAEILRQEIYNHTSERNITVTTQASIGIAFSSEYRYDYESLFAAADKALYHAKTEGRNKVVVID